MKIMLSKALVLAVIALFVGAGFVPIENVVADQFHTVMGYLYIDGELTDGITVALSFPGENYHDTTYDGGRYNICFQGHEGETGTFEVSILGIITDNLTYIVPMSESIEMVDLHVDTTDGFIYVDDNAPLIWYDATHVKTIQEGIDNATAWDTVFVYNGTYYEHVTINKNYINLTGENRETTIIDVEGYGQGIDGAGLDIPEYCHHNFVSGFTLINATYTGIWIHSEPAHSGAHSDYNTISDCSVYDCTGVAGIRISGRRWTCHADYNTIKDCIVYNISGSSGIGIHLDAGDGTAYAVGNKIINCTSYNNNFGIVFGGGGYSSYNIIVNCTVYNNSNYGISVDNNDLVNQIYHNNLFNNGQNAFDDNTNTLWYNATLQEGNYWSDYTGVDIDGDGIGDTPHDIPGGSNQDLYPLICQPTITKMGIIPSDSQVILGDNFNITIFIDPVDEIGGWQIYQLNYTQGLANATGVTPGPDWESNFDNGTINNTYGKITNVQTWTTGPYPDTNHTACNISFKALQPGECTIELVQVKITNSEFEQIDVITYNVTIDIITKPVVYEYYPMNGSVGIGDCGEDALRPSVQLCATIGDPDGDTMDVYIRWKNHTGEWVTLSNYTDVLDGFYAFNTTDNDWIWGNTTYTWSMNITDGTFWVNQTFYYTTDGSRYDVNNDCDVNFQDAGLVWIHRTSEVDYDGIYDVNQNGEVNFQDAGLTWVNRD